DRRNLVLTQHPTLGKQRRLAPAGARVDRTAAGAARAVIPVCAVFHVGSLIAAHCRRPQLPRGIPYAINRLAVERQPAPGVCVAPSCDQRATTPRRVCKYFHKELEARRQVTAPARFQWGVKRCWWPSRRGAISSLNTFKR